MEVQCAVSSADVQSEDDQGGEMECEEDPLNWQSLVSQGVLASLTPQEIKRQEVINGEWPTFDTKIIKYTNGISAYTYVSVHAQSCSTLSAPTCGGWRCWTVFSTRGWTEMVSCPKKTSNTSLLTWRKSFSCMVTSFTHCYPARHRRMSTNRRINLQKNLLNANKIFWLVAVCYFPFFMKPSSKA